MILTPEELRKYIEKRFMTPSIINHANNKDDSYMTDPFLSSKPTMYDRETSTDDNNNLQSKPFKYLDDNILSSDMSSFSRDLTESYKIHLCLFSINQELDTPFLQFMFSKKDSSYMFPSTDLDMTPFREANTEDAIVPSMESDDDNDDNSVITNYDNSTIDNEFMKQCQILFYEITKQPEDAVDIHGIYRGFLDDDSDNDIYVFFDCTGLHVDINHDKFESFDYIFAIVDEINKKQINGVDIDTNIISLFETNSFVKRLNLMNGEPTPIPQISYLCNQNDDESIHNEFYEDGNEMAIVNTQIPHDKYGDIYAFSGVSLDDNYDKIKRVALFYEENKEEEENLIEPDEKVAEKTEEEENLIEPDEKVDETDVTEAVEEKIEEATDESVVESDVTEAVEEKIEETGDSIVETDVVEEDDDSGSSSDSDTDEDDDSGSSSDSDTEEDDESGSSSSGSDDEEDNDSGSNSDTDEEETESSEENNEEEENELVENAVFRFAYGERTLYGTYSEESFVVL